MIIKRQNWSKQLNTMKDWTQFSTFVIYLRKYVSFILKNFLYQIVVNVSFKYNSNFMLLGLPRRVWRLQKFVAHETISPLHYFPKKTFSNNFCFLPFRASLYNFILYKIKMPWSSSYGKRLTFRRSWVWITAPNTGWTFLTCICCKNCYDVYLKRPKINAQLKNFNW